jgi:murein DD-endopeptidase MepM/ murein hydrolase activator NlpD
MAVYAHLRYPSVTVKVGDEVRQGHVLGFMGTTGHSTGIHLHFEIRYLNEGAKQASMLNTIEVDGLALSGFKVGTVSNPKYYRSTQSLP